MSDESKAMKTRQLGDITINRILELEAPYARPLDFFDAALPEAVEPHRHWLEPRALDPETGKIIMPVQSYLIRTRHHTILIDTCIHTGRNYCWRKTWGHFLQLLLKVRRDWQKPYLSPNS